MDFMNNFLLQAVTTTLQYSPYYSFHISWTVLKITYYVLKFLFYQRAKTKREAKAPIEMVVFEKINYEKEDQKLVEEFENLITY